ncbi:MAG: 1-(5-phosphoribosyl)-5-[(5-phosphoribosylamino)methylideneamino]imidazole-4-carboxamide isomerase [Nannocystales bacterium]
MILIPAIDLMGGKAVRLAQGERDRVTTYSDDPVGLAQGFARAGAGCIHVVDLDGAFEGNPTHRKIVVDICRAAAEHDVRVQTGGGIRDAATVDALIDAGVDRVVLGTLAIKDPTTVEALCQKHADRIVVAADARDGMVALEGWTEKSEVTALQLAQTAARWGAAAVLHTDVSRDGMQGGPAVDGTASIQKEVSIPVYASGGVGSLDHIEACARADIAGVVLGRALYEGAFTVEEALSRC